MFQGVIATYVALELSLLVLAVVGSLHVAGLFVAASALKLASALFMMVLSVMDHSRSPRPSILLNSYLFLTLLLDGAQARTLFLSSGGRPEITYSSIKVEMDQLGYQSAQSRGDERYIFSRRLLLAQ